MSDLTKDSHWDYENNELYWAEYEDWLEHRAKRITTPLDDYQDMVHKAKVAAELYWQEEGARQHAEWLDEQDARDKAYAADIEAEEGGAA